MLAVFWIGLYVFVNLASVMYLGGLALQTILGIDMLTGVIGLAAFAAAYSLYGGLSAVAWTDIIQVVVLLIGGLITSFSSRHRFRWSWIYGGAYGHLPCGA